MLKEIKYKGYTATPSDYVCEDGELALAVNMMHEDAELKPVRTPKKVFELNEGEEALIIHIVNDNEKHLIIKDGNKLYYVNMADEQAVRIQIPIRSDHTSAFKCSATGNMLCVFGDGEIEHFLWIYGSYRGLNPSKYDVPILFGVDVGSATRSHFATIQSMLVNTGSPQARWESIVDNARYERRGKTSFTFPCALYPEEDYRIQVTSDVGGRPYIVGTFFDSNGGIVLTSNLCRMGEWSSVIQVPQQVSSISLSFRSNSYDGGVYGSNLQGTITVQKKIEDVTPGEGDIPYSYNPADSVNTAVLGVVNSLVAQITSDNRFSMPFFVRYGFRLITGDIVTVSAPILIEPNTGVAPIIGLTNIQQQGGEGQESSYYRATATAIAYAGTLQYKVKDLQLLQNLLAADNMIDTLVIAVSDPIYMYKQGATTQDFSEETYLSLDKGDSKSYAIDGIQTPTPQADYYLNIPQYRNYTERVLSAFNFHIVKEIEKSEISADSEFVDVPLPDGCLSGLAGNLNLLNDNVDILSSYESDYVMTYNQREHLIGYKETKYGGFMLDCMSGYVAGTDHYTNYDVSCQLPDAEGIQHLVRGKATESSVNRRWFYYPNTNALSVDIYENGNKYNIELEKHPFLNGSFHIGDIGEGVIDSESGIDKPASMLTEGKPNMIFVSAQANPLVMDQKLRVGDGILYAAAANTRPITRNQYGGVPLYAFSSDGIWGIELTAEGKYLTRQTVSRDVCENIDSITSIDTAVLFATDRGIMMLHGSDTTCISEDLQTEHPFTISQFHEGLLTLIEGHLQISDIEESEYIAPNFHTFVIGCRMMYDYIHQQIVVYNQNYRLAYIYSISDKKWSMMICGIEYTINAYPEAWAVTNGEILNFSAVAEEEEQEEVVVVSDEPSEETEQVTTASDEPITGVKGLLVTRPLKLDAPNALKTVQAVVQRGVFRKGNVKTILYGSRDLFNWLPIRSSVDHYLRGFSGTPYKYFRVVLLCEMQPDESIYGCSVQYEPKQINKLR